MNRRDTIIIAVLLNAGLLIVLFATSLKSGKTEIDAPEVQVLASNPSDFKESQPSLVAIPPAHSSSDEIDQTIKNYVTPQATTPVPEQNFLADLQAIGASDKQDVSQPQAPIETATTFKEIKVKKGDVLERIARQNHVTVDAIMETNKLSSTRLKIGQTLKIPSGSSKKTQTSSENGAQYYTIKNGDNPWTVAVKHHMKVEELLELNHMDEQKARRLKPGDRIRIK